MVYPIKIIGAHQIKKTKKSKEPNLILDAQITLCRELFEPQLKTLDEKFKSIIELYENHSAKTLSKVMLDLPVEINFTSDCVSLCEEQLDLDDPKYDGLSDEVLCDIEGEFDDYQEELYEYLKKFGIKAYNAGHWTYSS